MDKHFFKEASITAKRIVMLVIGGLSSGLVLAFSVLTIIGIMQNGISVAPRYLFWVFFFMGLSTFISYLRKRTTITLIKSIVLFIFNVGLGILVLFANKNLYLFSLTAGLYCIIAIIGRVFRIIELKTVRAIISNILIILGVSLLAVGLLIPVDADNITAIVLIECMFIAVTAFAEVAIVAFGQLKLDVLLKIVVKTYALEVLWGLLAIMIASSLVLMVVEPEIGTFGDGLWYSFSVVTTIGFGYVETKSLVGRLITVILGIYGIIAVAVITSIIVNFYNETASKKSVKEIKEIKKDAIEEIEKEEAPAKKRVKKAPTKKASPKKNVKKK